MSEKHEAGHVTPRWNQVSQHEFAPPLSELLNLQEICPRLLTICSRWTTIGKAENPALLFELAKASLTSGRNTRRDNAPGKSGRWDCPRRSACDHAGRDAMRNDTPRFVKGGPSRGDIVCLSRGHVFPVLDQVRLGGDGYLHYLDLPAPDWNFNEAAGGAKSSYRYVVHSSRERVEYLRLLPDWMSSGELRPAQVAVVVPANKLVATRFGCDVTCPDAGLAATNLHVAQALQGTRASRLRWLGAANLPWHSGGAIHMADGVHGQ